MSNLKRLCLLASLGACVTSGNLAKGDQDEDAEFADGGTTAEGCPDSLGSLGALPESSAVIYSNAVSSAHFINEPEAMLELDFTRIENARELQTTTYTLSGAHAANACLE